MKIQLIQPRHIFAENNGFGHVYLPGSILTAGARLLKAGVEVEFNDENIKPTQINCSNIGLSLLGPPYIWKATEMLHNYKDSLDNQTKYFLGGQVVSGLLSNEFNKLFGKNVYNGNDDLILSKHLNFDLKCLPKTEETSLIPMYEKISNNIMFEYLTREFSLNISQGCKYNCSFCSAVRTKTDPISGKLIRIKEVYRNLDIIEKDLDYLINRALRLNINSFQIYMSNLDVFQSPLMLTEFTNICQTLLEKYSKFKLNLRGLSTVASFLNVDKKSPEIIQKLVNVGFYSVGFGVDGMTPMVWKKINKGSNSEDKCINAIKLAKIKYNIIPELLMVFGHDGIDTEASLKAAYEFTLSMVEKFEAVPRPHISKGFIPGNEGWFTNENKGNINVLLENPILFQSLDFTALPTRLTHSDNIRDLASYYFLKICSIKGNTTQWIKPFTPEMTEIDKIEAIKFNLNKFDR